MDNVVYDMVKSFYPIRQCMKLRQDGEFWIVANYNQDIFYLNETAAEFYEACTGENRIMDCFNLMKQQYDISEDELKRDVMELVRNLQWQDIIRLEERINEKVSETICM